MDGGVTEFPGDGGEEAVLAGDGFAAGEEEHETAGTVSAFDEAGLVALLAEEGGLLVAGDAADGDAVAEEIGGGFAEIAAAGDDAREAGGGDVEEGHELAVPVAMVDIHQHGAGGVGDVGDVIFSAGELEDEPGVDGAGGEFASLGAGAGIGDLAEEPVDFAGGEVGVEDEAGLLLDEGFLAAVAEGGHVVGGAAVLPDDGVVERLAGVFVPEEGGLALVGDAEGGDVGGGDARFFNGLAGGLEDGLPDLGGVVLDPTGLGEVLGEFLLRDGEGAAAVVVDDGAGAGGALIESEEVFHGETNICQGRGRGRRR